MPPAAGHGAAALSCTGAALGDEARVGDAETLRETLAAADADDAAELVMLGDALLVALNDNDGFDAETVGLAIGLALPDGDGDRVGDDDRDGDGDGEAKLEPLVDWHVCCVITRTRLLLTSATKMRPAVDAATPYGPLNVAADPAPSALPSPSPAPSV